MKRKLAVLLAAVMLSAALIGGCKAVPANADRDSVVGKWKDSYGLTEYEFQPDGVMKIQALHLGSFKGTYRIENGRITLAYRVLLKEETHTYALRLEGDTMYLDKNEFKRKK